LFFILIILLLVYATIGILIHRNFANYLTIYSGIWLTIILLYSLRLSYLQVELSITTIKYFIAIFSAFFMGYLIALTIFLPEYKNKGNRRHKIKKYKVNFNQKFITYSFWIIVLAMILQVIYSGGVPLFWLLMNVNKNYFAFGIPTFNGLVLSFLVFFSTILYINLRQNFSAKQLIYFIIIIIIPILLINRQVLITIIVQLLVAHYLFINKIKIRKLVYISIIGIVIFGIIGNYRTGLQDFILVSRFKDTEIGYLSSGFYWVYMYLTMSIANINNLFTNFNFLDLNYGLNMLRSYVPTIFLDVLFDTNSYSQVNFLVTINYNVSGYMVSPFLDFGQLGVVVYTFFLGIICSIVYHNFIFNNTVTNKLIFIVILLIISMSFFIDFLLYLPVSFQLVWIVILKNKYLKGNIKQGIDSL
jgi:oligosaccharide repeat unit polymerase